MHTVHYPLLFKDNHYYLRDRELQPEKRQVLPPARLLFSGQSTKGTVFIVTDRIKMEVPFFQVPNAIFDVGLNSFELSVYMYLARCSNGGAKAFPSYATIAAKCGMSKRKAVDVVNLLERVLLLKKKGRRGKKKGENYSNVYTVEHNISVEALKIALQKERGKEEAKDDNGLKEEARFVYALFAEAGATEGYTEEIEAEIIQGIKDGKTRKEKTKWKIPTAAS